MQFTGLLLQFTTTAIIVYSFNSHFQLNWGQTVLHHIFLLLVALYFTGCYVAPVTHSTRREYNASQSIHTTCDGRVDISLSAE